VRDTIARRSDVDAKSVEYDIEPGTGSYRKGTITFAAKKGKSIDLKKLAEDLRKTRLGKKTRSGVVYLEVTAEGEVAVIDKQTRLKVRGSGEEFTLADEPKAKPTKGAKTAYQRLTEALSKGEKIASVTGRVEGWSGVWPKVLSELAGEPAGTKDKPAKPAACKPPLLMVTGFQTARK
jgi:hypothetical protein